MDVSGMELSNEWLIKAAADARKRGSQYTTYFDLLVANLHGYMPYRTAQEVAERKVQERLKEEEEK